MVRPHAPQPVETPPRQIGCLAAITRLAWLVGSVGALAILTIVIARRATFSALDAVFWGVVLLTALIRLIDITRFAGETADGETATMATWRRYVVRLVAGAGVAWGLAHTLLPPIVP